MPPTLYKLIHLFGVFTLLTVMGRYVVAKAQDDPLKKVMAWHGSAMLLILVAGFGMLAKLGIGAPSEWPFWVWVKLLIWVYLGALPFLVRRKPEWGLIWSISTPLLAVLAAGMALTKFGA